MSALYVHLPFCRRKCLYCSYVVAVAQEHHIGTYVRCLTREASQHKGTRVSSVYWGGGTPSLLGEAELGALCQVIKRNFLLPEQAEWTIEMNPEDVNPRKIKFLLSRGINRFSLGAQTFQDRFLRFLGRRHSVKDIYGAYEVLRACGCANISLDLIFAFPGQTFDEFEDDVRQIVGLQSEHLSLYALNVEKNSRFFIDGINPSADKQQIEFYKYLADYCAAHRLEQYEVSNFARPGYRSRHNLNYWRGGDYIGLGVAAHSHQRGTRFWNVDRLREYLKRVRDGESPEGGKERLTEAQQLSEIFLLGLRMNEGVNLRVLEKRFGVHFPPEKSMLVAELVREGLLERERDNLRATFRGRLVLDDISARLI